MGGGPYMILNHPKLCFITLLSFYIDSLLYVLLGKNNKNCKRLFSNSVDASIHDVLSHSVQIYMTLFPNSVVVSIHDFYDIGWSIGESFPFTL